jgi:hypothetical protein
MPVVFRYKGYKFFFYSNEGSQVEKGHIHVRKGEKTAKFWLTPEVELCDSYGMNSSELNELTKIIEENLELFIRNWNEYFNK